MAKREWRWVLPGGEVVEARIEDGAESVLVGGRKVARSSPQGSPGSFAFDVGGMPAYVRFDRTGQTCALAVGGIAIAPTLSPRSAEAAAVVEPAVAAAIPAPAPALVAPGGVAPIGVAAPNDAPAAPPARFSPELTALSPRRIGAAAAGLAVVAYLATIGFHSPGAAWERTKAANTGLAVMHASSDNAIVARYPADFSVAQADHGWIAVRHDGVPHEMAIGAIAEAPPPESPEDEEKPAADPPPDIDPLPGLFERALPGSHYQSTKSNSATCHEEGGVRWDGDLELQGEKMHAVSCIFYKYGLRYVTAYTVPVDRVYEAEPVLERITAGLTLVDPSRLPFGPYWVRRSSYRRH